VTNERRACGKGGGMTYTDAEKLRIIVAANNVAKAYGQTTDRCVTKRFRRELNELLSALNPDAKYAMYPNSYLRITDTGDVEVTK